MEVNCWQKVRQDRLQFLKSYYLNKSVDAGNKGAMLNSRYISFFIPILFNLFFDISNSGH